MIDTDKMKMAYAATPLCQGTWTTKDGNSPSKLCAISAMVSFAGVQPDLIHKMHTVLSGKAFVTDFLLPVIEAEYGVPEYVAREIPAIFDQQENEWVGVQRVLALCEEHNMDERHADAIVEDRLRFPQHTCQQGTYITLCGTDGAPSPWLVTFDEASSITYAWPETVEVTPKVSAKKGQSKFWTADPKPKVAKTLALK